jgi:hypothetical protein
MNPAAPFIPNQRLWLPVFILLFLWQPHGVAYGNQPIQEEAKNGRLTVFLDCPGWCDTNFIQQQIPLVNYVRDKELAQVHVIITRHGGGRTGTTYMLSILGSRQFSGMINELSYWAPSTNTADQNRRGYTNQLKIGLAPYIAGSSMAEYVRVEFTYDPRDQQRVVSQVKDPWNNWVFEVYGGGNFSKEEKSSSFNLRYGFHIEKQTHDIKVRIRPFFNNNQRIFITEDQTIRRNSHRHGFDGYLIHSISDHWSAGLFSSMLSSTFHNFAFNTELKPAIEYSLFPYSEATMRSISFAYRIGGGWFNYMERTIFQKDDEFLFGHSIEAAARFQQTWGTVRAGISGSHFFHDFSANRASMFGILNLRVFQGFAISLSSNLELINDLVSIPMGDLSLEDILLQQRRQSTSYQLSGSIGLSYTFGSATTGVYNPRF